MPKDTRLTLLDNKVVIHVPMSQLSRLEAIISRNLDVNEFWITSNKYLCLIAYRPKRKTTIGLIHLTQEAPTQKIWEGWSTVSELLDHSKKVRGYITPHTATPEGEWVLRLYLKGRVGSCFAVIKDSRLNTYL